MSYNTTGVSHQNGVENEQGCYEWLIKNINNVPFLSGVIPENIIKVGGTKSKNDIEILRGDNTKLGVSLKNIDRNGSSHDWINSTLNKFSDLLSLDISLHTQVNAINQKISEIRSLPHEERASLKKSFKAFRKETTNQFLDSLSLNTDILHGIIYSCFEPIKEQLIIVNNKKDKCYQFYFADIHPIYNYLDKTKYNLVLTNPTGKSKESRKLQAFDKSTGQISDIGIRLRMVTNNGDSAAIGIGTGKNTNSTLVFKIQQDSVRKFLETLKNNNLLSEFNY